MPKFVIRIQDKEFKVVTQYAIPPYLKQEYIASAGVLVTEKQTYNFPNGDYCQGCDAESINCPGETLLVCTSLVVNHIYGYPIKVCSLCQWYLQVRCEDYPINLVPKKIRDSLKKGHKAKNVVSRLSM